MNQDQNYISQQAKCLSLIQNSQAAMTINEEFNLYQSTITFLNDQCKKQLFNDCIIYFLNSFNKQILFHSLFSFLLQKIQLSRSKQLQNKALSFVESLIDTVGSENKQTVDMKKKIVISLVLKGKCGLEEELIKTCQKNQQRSLKVLKLVNDWLQSIMRSETVKNVNFTNTLVLSLKIVQIAESIDCYLLDQTLRHILLVDIIEKGQVIGIVAQNPTLLDKILNFDRITATVSGYWFVLIQKIASNQSNFSQQCHILISQAYERAYLKIVNSIVAEASLSNQIDKIVHSNKQQKQKIRLIQIIRGYCIFISKYACSASKDINQLIRIIQQLLAIKDFLCFQFLIRAYFQLITNNFASRQLSAETIRNIQQNCLPLQLHSHNQSYNIDELHFLQNTFQDDSTYRSSSQSSEAFNYFLTAILQKRGCLNKKSVCLCFQDYIHTAIENQYDNEFNPHKFMSACHLMCHEIKRVINLSPSTQQLSALKVYVTTNLKWLLNLNQSCLPQYRRCINLKIFDLLISFPDLLVNNQFLENVVDDLLISRFPLTLSHLQRLISYYGSDAGMGENYKLKRLSDKIIQKCCGKNQFKNQLDLWNLIAIIWQHQENKIIQAMQACQQEDTLLAQYCVAKVHKLQLAKHLQTKANAVKSKMQLHCNFYKQTLEAIELFLKNVQV